MEKIVIRRLVFSMTVVIGLQGQTARADAASVQMTERTLAAVLQWEVFWNDSPSGFRIPADGSITLAIYAASDFVSYCSHQAGVCVTYRTGDYRNWEGSNSAKCEGSGSDEDALLAFVGKGARKPAGGREAPMVLGRGGLSGSPAPGSGITWTTKVTLGSRAEIVRRYQQMHPAEIESLTRWIRSSMNQTGVRSSITIACFAPTDPMVYYYVDRATKEPVVMAAYWDREREEWVGASSLVRSQGSQRFDEMRRTIESVACSTVRSE
jgi:hypothetical protein